MVNWGFVGYVAVTKWYLGFLDGKEQMLFREMVCEFMREGKEWGVEKGGRVTVERKYEQIQEQISQIQSQISNTTPPSEHIQQKHQLHKPTPLHKQHATPDLLQELDNFIKPVLSHSNPIKIHYKSKSIEMDPRKTLVLLQMGSKNYPRLEKYYLQSEGKELKIVSSHGRQFQRHELKEVRELGNQFYEMIFDEQNELIRSRIAKFPNGLGEYRRFVKRI